MTADVVNLRRARKAKKRQDAEQAAQIQRATFGRTKSERDLARSETLLANRRLDAHRRELDESPPEN